MREARRRAHRRLAFLPPTLSCCRAYSPKSHYNEGLQWLQDSPFYQVSSLLPLSDPSPRAHLATSPSSPRSVLVRLAHLLSSLFSSCSTTLSSIFIASIARSQQQTHIWTGSGRRTGLHLGETVNPSSSLPASLSRTDPFLFRCSQVQQDSPLRSLPLRLCLHDLGDHLILPVQGRLHLRARVEVSPRPSLRASSRPA